MSDFSSLGLGPTILKALERAEFTQPTKIQEKAIPLALDGHDIMGLAQTGTGKTLAFGLPMIDRLLDEPGKPLPKTAKALVLAPTRELVGQIADNMRPMVQNTPLKIMTVVGGQSINRQVNALSRGTDILVATPGRLIDLMDRGSVDLSTVRYLVLDEADQMLDMGFIHALRRIAPKLGTPRQTMLFSATMPKQMEELSRSYLTDPRRVEVAPPGKTADKIEQSVEFMEKGDKPGRLREILSEDTDALTLVFMRTKHTAERLMKKLVADGYNAASIHGNKSQGQRDRAIKGFREGSITVLVATDVAARGIDIPGVARVVNFDLPNVAESYVHRIGRTARAGREGVAVSFCAPDEHDYLRDIQKLVGLDFGLPARKGGGNGGGNGGRPGGAKPANGAAKPGGNSRNRNRNRRRRGGGGKPAAAKMQSA
ncbi:DEAD/DEAH box helicase [Thalassovita mangrovi]|uniref:DEAD/DEAH box helicase n=1 Tax=Thalassovita mangrovi TaxID=2692236 RepID=A0A6L8LKE5_9RHOB|nr:DEAD/DEAH box helicase [Thalassovita mangrovi]